MNTTNKTPEELRKELFDKLNAGTQENESQYMNEIAMPGLVTNINK